MVVALAALFVLSGLSLATFGLQPPPSTPGAALGRSSTTTTLGGSVPSSPVAPVSSGRGTFFTDSPIPLLASNQTCIPPGSVFGPCVNVSNDPAIARTPNGVLAVAFTEWTNQSLCPAVGPWAQSEVMLATSSDNGSTWSTPRALGFSNCSQASLWPSAWEPTLTALANGTLVLAFVGYNLTAGFSVSNGVLFGGWYTPHTVTNSSLVVEESYDGGSAWTSPQVLNASAANATSDGFTPERPWLAAYGQTIYLTWMNLTNASSYNISTYQGYGSSQVHLIVSTNGGGSWGSAVDLAAFRNGTGPATGMNPFVAVGPSGEVYVAYDTDGRYYQCYPASATNCLSAWGVLGQQVYTVDVEVASSVNNGTTFSYGAIGSGILATAPTSYGVWSQYASVSPQLAVNPLDGQVYATWSQDEPSNVCAIGSGCNVQVSSVVMFANSSNGGVNWSVPHPAAPGLTDNATGQMEIDPAIAVDSAGQIELASTYVNEQVAPECVYTGYLTYYCPTREVYLDSTDNGTSFSTPYIVNYTASPYSADTGGYLNAPDGEYATMVASGTKFWLGWTHDTCPGGPTAYCSFPGYSNLTTLSSQVTVSTPFVGSGVSLRFNSTGLANGTTWSVAIMGNQRVGIAPAQLTVSGVPPSELIGWTAANVPGAYGVRYTANASPVSPAIFPTNSTIDENYSEQVLVNISTNVGYGDPNAYYCVYTEWPCWNDPVQLDVNYNITPLPESSWVPLGTPFSEAVTPASYWCLYPWGCYYTPWANLTFESWTGSGAGSVNTTGLNLTFAAQGPVNETANFQVNGVCEATPGTVGGTTISCVPLNQTLLFDETGLPVGTNWSVTLYGYQGANLTATSTSSTIDISSNVTLGPVHYVVWTLPSSTPGLFWVGTGTPQSPVLLPGQRVVNVTFTEERPGAANMTLEFTTAGLPAGSNWSLTLDSASLGMPSTPKNLTISGGVHAVNPSPVYETGGTAYYAASVTIDPYVVGEANATYGPIPRNLTFNGSAIVTVNYEPEFWATVSAGPGGTVSPSSQWVPYGASLSLSASPSLGDQFVGWTGLGPGSTSGSSENVTISPRGPVSELATFAPNPPVEWNISLTVTGLTGGTDALVSIGNRTFAGTGTFTASGFVTGTYLVTAEIAYSNSTNGTRFVPETWTTSFSRPAAGSITVASDGWLNVTYGEQDLLTVASNGPGTVAPAPGAYWYANGANVTLTASPGPMARLVGWMGIGGAAVSSSALRINVTVEGPTGETAGFASATPPLPATFRLTVEETGLPVGMGWNVSLGAIGIDGIGTSLVVPGLNGTYTAVVSSVYVGSEVRFAANVSGIFTRTLSISSNVTLALVFVKQDLVTVSTSAGGSVNVVSEWVDAGSSITLIASPSNLSWVFASWNGTNPSTSAIFNVTVNAPVRDQAVFAPVYPAAHSGSSAQGESTALLVFAVVLIGALIVGMLIGRRRAPPVIGMQNESGAAVDAPEYEDISEPAPEMAPPEDPQSGP